MRKKRTRSYTMTDREHAELITARLPYTTGNGDQIDTASGLIIYALCHLPRRKR